MKATVYVRPKQGILDPQGEAVRSALSHLGMTVEQARVGRVIDLDLPSDDAGEARHRLEDACERLLANPLIESYEIELEQT